MTQKAPDNESVFEFTVKDIDGKDVKLSKYKGKVMLFVNVASKCGLTPQYNGLQAVYSKYKEKGLVVLGFPANNFMGQEPGTNDEIKTFCSTKYNVSFPMFSKISVKGDDIDPLFAWLITKSGDNNDIAWNFGKFLVSPDGKTVKRFEPRSTPETKEIVAAIEASLPK
jgi:glutathione peroxidase